MRKLIVAAILNDLDFNLGVRHDEIYCYRCFVFGIVNTCYE
jgi:hypothetical protein